jgi:hypothetical protein
MAPAEPLGLFDLLVDVDICENLENVPLSDGDPRKGSFLWINADRQQR